MSRILLIIVALILTGCNATTPQKSEKAFIPLDESESALISKMESSGKKMYEKDIRAAKASDLVLSRIYPENYPNFVGWVTYENDTDYNVSFYQKNSDSEYSVLADVIYDSNDLEPEVIIEPQRSLSDTEISMIKARIAALENGVNSCSDKFNTIILESDKPDQWEVYILAATDDPDLVQVGGHIRVTVSRSTGEVVQTENLSKSCLTLDKSPDNLPDGATIEMLTMSHIVSDYPVEIHPYLNLLHGIGFAVITQRGLWFIIDGEISLVDTSGR